MEEKAAGKGADGKADCGIDLLVKKLVFGPVQANLAFPHNLLPIFVFVPWFWGKLLWQIQGLWKLVLLSVMKPHFNFLFGNTPLKFKWTRGISGIILSEADICLKMCPGKQKAKGNAHLVGERELDT